VSAVAGAVRARIRARTGIRFIADFPYIDNGEHTERKKCEHVDTVEGVAGYFC
jgi:hypothetical protein